MTVKTLFAAICVGLVATPAWSEPSVPATVTVDGGQIVGDTMAGVTAHLGVPFAAAPTGDRRWRAPEPVTPWQGVRPAKAFAPACIQDGVSMPGETPPSTSEDCLYLNVWAPTDAQDAPLPVMVWIYGGGFTNGAASMPLYHGDALARRGVVVVTLAYRVGPLGFLAHRNLRQSHPITHRATTV
jgi:para-nitrobenzyl esterase